MNEDTKVSKLLDKYKELSVAIMAGELLFRYHNVMSILDDCERQNIVILGVDFWEDYEGRYRELLNSFDYSDIYKKPNASKLTVELTKQKLEKGLPDNANYASFILVDGE